MSVTALRQKDWIFNAFWVACGEASAPKCAVRIPITCIFREGEPFKALGCDQFGIVKRIILEKEDVVRGDMDKGFRGKFRVLRKLLIDYSTENDYENVQLQNNQSPKICSIIYVDGGTENLTQDELDRLLRDRMWTKQVLLLQAFVPMISLQTGAYSHAPQVRSKVTTNSNEAADNFARAIAKYAERAYAIGAEELAGIERGASAKPITLKVMNIQCRFALDPHDNVVFLYADYTAVEIENGRKEVEDYMAQEQTGRITSAAQSVAKELLQILHHAAKSGMTPEIAFEHFDQEGRRSFNTDHLIDGLARLSIGVTYPVGEGVLEIIGGIGSQFVTLHEFKQFLDSPIDIRAFDSYTPSASRGNTSLADGGKSRNIRGSMNRAVPGSALEGSSVLSAGVNSRHVSTAGSKSIISRQSTAAVAEAKAVTPVKKLKGMKTRLGANASVNAGAGVDQTIQQLMPPLKESTFDSDFMNLAASQLYDWKDVQQPGGGGGKSGGKRARNSESVGVDNSPPKELPLPVSAYSTTGPQQRTSKDRTDTLSKRQKRALNTLRTGQRKHGFLGGVSLADGMRSSSSTSVPILPDAGGGRRGDSGALSAEGRSRAKSPSKTPPGTAGTAGKNPRHRLEPLSLQGIVQNMNDELLSESDELLHIDHGVFMTYRVLNGTGRQADEIKTHEKTDSLRYRSVLELRQKNLAKGNHGEQTTVGGENNKSLPECFRESTFVESSGAAAGKSIAEPVGLSSSFTLILIPDLFMALETLQATFEPLLARYPYAQLVLVGLPGMPNTVWPKDWVLNSDLHARAIAKLLFHLSSTGKLAYSDCESAEMARIPLFFMAMGHSSVCLSRFVTHFLPSLPDLHIRTRVVCMVNGLLKYSQRFKKVCRDLWRAMETANESEVNELITSLHFSDSYLAKNGRKETLEKFWSSRRGLQMERVAAEYAGSGFLGVIEQLKGILLSPDEFDGAQMLLTDIPVMVIQTNGDVFVDPMSAAVFTPDQLPPERALVREVADCLDPAAVLVSWLDAGHEVIQERSSFLIGRVCKLAELCGIHPAVSGASQAASQHRNSAQRDMDDMFDVLNMAQTGLDPQQQQGGEEREGEGGDMHEASADAHLTEAERIEKERLRKESERERARLAREEAKRLEAEQLAEEERLAAEAAIKEEEERVAAKERKAADKRNKTKNLQDSKAKELKQSRELQMEILRKKEQADKDHRNEGRENLKMMKEDQRSKFAEDYRIECQIAETSRLLAKARAAELAVLRRDEAVKRVEEDMARKRAAHIEERRARAQELVASIKREELTLAGEEEGGYAMPTDRSAVQLVIESSNRLMRDLLECRMKSIEALKRQQLIQEKTELFRKQLSTVENDESRLRRAIKLIRNNPAIVGAEMNAETQIDELEGNLAAKQETLQELTALARQREQQLDAANCSAQSLKIATQDRDQLMQDRVQELHQFETNLANSLSEMKMEKEKMIINRDRMRIKVIEHQKRVDVVSKERARVKGAKGELIDTDVWVEGVMQRCDRKKLKEHLKIELKKAEDLRDGVLVQLNQIREDIFMLMEKMAQVKRDLGKITGVTKVLFRTYRKFNSVSITQIMDSLNNRQKAANNLERRRAKEEEVEKQFARAGSNSLVDRVRLKESDIRTKEERQFVGIDLVMNPEAYMHLSVVEAEQMQFDEDYHCSLSKTDLERIGKLPEQISLALPFLHTVEEVNAHKLINTFIRDKNEMYFQNRDYSGSASGLGGVESVAGTDDASRSTFDDMSFMMSHAGVSSDVVRSSEIMHEILVRESLRDRLRAAGAGDFLTEDEQKWLVIDRILSPHVYDATELEGHAEPSAPARVRTVDNTLNTSINTKTVGAPRNEKEKFDALRADYEAGKDMFGSAWKCLFNRKQLLHIRSLPVEKLREDEAYVRSLMDKYYVDSKESTLGHSTLKMAERATRKVAKVVLLQDKASELELSELREHHASEPDDASTLKSGRSFASSYASTTRRRSMVTNGSTVGTAELHAGEEIARVWGSWNEVHPASAGKESQISYFQLSTFDASRDHPACFAERPVSIDDEELSEDEDETDVAVIAPKTGGGNNFDENDLYTSLFGEVSANGKPSIQQKNDPNSNFHITDSIAELAQSDARKLRGKIVLMRQHEPLTLLEVKNASLQGRQSRSHYFTLPSRESVRALDITVSIIFKGDFAGKGYRLGRLAAGLFRLPPEGSIGSKHGGGKSSHASTASAPPIPESVGYAPYHLQSPNLPDAMGRLVILHRPRNCPLPPGTFQIVVGAASNTKYSIEVSCTVGKTALPIVDEAITQARQCQSRLPTCLLEIEGIEESVRLAERKLLVCEKMVQEAELESERSQKGMRLITKRLERDDEDMGLMEDERRDLQRELGIFEVEYAQWAGTFATRSREKDDIKDGIRMMYSFKRDKIKEKDDIKKKLEDARRDLPACLVILRNTAEAVHVAMSLNTIVQGVTEEASAATAGDFGGIQVSTPAEDVRRNLKQYGLKALSIEEQQWCTLDQALNPHKYEWMKELEEKERMEREAVGKKPKEKKSNPATEDFKLNKVEIEYILDTPFSMLSRKEVVIRKLLTKYHDDKEALQKAIAAVAYSFDPHLAERTRAKNPKSYTTEEHNWSTVDRVLHPEIWAFYVNRQNNWLDRHEKEATNANADHVTGKHKHRQGKGKNKPVREPLSPEPDRVSEEIEAQAAATRERTVSEEVMGELHQSLRRSGTDGAMLVSRGSTRRSKIIPTANKGPWVCPFNKEEIMRIWRTPRHFLKTDDEREVYKLLQKYNGAYSSYMDAVLHAKRRQGHFVKEGAHIQWEKLGKLVSKDVDFRARQLLREIDRATFTKNEWISSDVLHANDQKFPTRVLRMHLEEALDVLLTEQIRDRERAEKIRVDSSDSEDEEDAAILLALEQDDDVSLEDSDDGGGMGGDAEILSKVRKRAERREKRKRKLKRVNEEQEVLKVKKVLAKKKTGVALAEAILQNQLGVGGCLACRTKKCRWKPSVDVEVCEARRRVLDEELERVRADRDSIIFESDVCLSVQLGGNRVFKRQDLMEELMFEQRELAQRIDLNNIDLELHDAYATRKEYFESKYLHGYSLLLWTNNARQALEMRQSRLCALSVSKEVVDDILDWMLEGWFFGERESQFKVLGYVPSIKSSGKVRAGQDQISSVAQVVAKMKARADNRRKNIATAESTQGEMLEKAWTVEQDSQQKMHEQKVARDGNEHEHMLNETETTLKFGIFMLTLMYFRAMTFLRREQKSWSNEGDEIGIKAKGKNDKVMTDERMRMLDEENRAAARKKKVDIVLARCKIGEARRAEREAAERREAILRLQAVVRRQRLEQESISCIQKMYRGHIGRKAAKRWALKRAELGAMNALLHSTAIAIQRVFRGYEGRLYAVHKRTEMAQFIALMRVQESQQDEEIYWQTHPWSRFKKNRKEWLNAKLEKYRSSGALGGSRLSAAEQAQLEGRTLEEIRRQIEGLDDGEEEEEDDVEGAETSTAAGFSAYNDPQDT